MGKYILGLGVQSGCCVCHRNAPKPGSVASVFEKGLACAKAALD